MYVADQGGMPTAETGTSYPVVGHLSGVCQHLLGRPLPRRHGDMPVICGVNVIYDFQVSVSTGVSPSASLWVAS